MKQEYFLDELTLNVHDLENMKQYYNTKIGLPILKETNSEVTFGHNLPLITLRKVESSHRKQNTGLYHLALLLNSRQHLGEFLVHLIQNKIPIDGASDHGYSEALYLTDPEGNGIEVYADKDESQWDVRESGEIVGITIAMDAQGVINEAKETFTQMNNQTILGHVHYYVTDLNATQAFYVDALGFDLKLDYGHQAKFMASGMYHHHIGANTWKGTHLKAPLEDDLGINHMVISTTKDLTEINQSLLDKGYLPIYKDNTISVKDNSGIPLKIIKNNTAL